MSEKERMKKIMDMMIEEDLYIEYISIDLYDWFKNYTDGEGIILYKDRVFQTDQYIKSDGTMVNELMMYDVVVLE